MPLYYFVRIPELPPSVRHQSGDVEVVEYLVAEGETVSAGAPLLRVQNWWALMELQAVGPGIVSKTFFNRGTRVLVGDPIGIIDCDGEHAPHGDATAELRVIKNIRAKPQLSEKGV